MIRTKRARSGALAATLIGALACFIGCTNNKGGLNGLSILARGGDGTVEGGAGGNVSIVAGNGGDLEIKRRGRVDASFSVPDDMPYLGDNPFVVTATMTLTPPTGSATIKGSADPSADATGLWVQRGVTLTIEPNFSGQSVNVAFPNGVYIEGAIKTGRRLIGGASTEDGAHLQLGGANIVITRSGSIDTSGDDVPDGKGGDGGDFTTAGGGSPSALSTTEGITGTVVNEGQIDTSGGDGLESGDGGRAVLVSLSYGVFNTGDVFAAGGNATDGDGGDGGEIRLEAGFDQANRGQGLGALPGGVFNRGDLTSRGGDGTTGGGSAGDINLIAWSVGAIVNQALLDATGGDATLDGDGGPGGEIQLLTQAGTLRIRGALLANGGNGAGEGDGKMGGGVIIKQNSDLNGLTAGSPQILVQAERSGGASIGAQIETSGGRGEIGGDGGLVTVVAGGIFLESTTVQGGSVPASDPMRLIGYSTVDVSGGSSGQGGDAGDGGLGLVVNAPGVDVIVPQSPALTGFLRGPSFSIVDQIANGNVHFGNLTNTTTWISNGGDAVDGQAGDGGLIAFSIGFSRCAGSSGDNRLLGAFPDYNRRLFNTGSLAVRGGKAANSNDDGDGGMICLSDHFRVVNRGTLDASATGATGDGGFVQLTSDVEVFHKGTIFVQGGEGIDTSSSGDGGFAMFVSRRSTVGGRIFARGGNDGGAVEIASTERRSKVGAAMDVSTTGKGSSPTTGRVVIDGVRVQLDPNGRFNP